jgi:hypothetical protein
LKAPAPQYSRVETGLHTSLHGRRTASASSKRSCWTGAENLGTRDKAAQWEHVQFFI